MDINELTVGQAKKSGVVGVTWDRCSHAWKASIKARGRSIHLGHFKTILEAARVRGEAEKIYRPRAPVARCVVGGGLGRAYSDGSGYGELVE